MVKRFAEENPYEFVAPILAQYTVEMDESEPREKVKDEASKAVLAMQRSEIRSQSRLLITTLLLVTCLAVGQTVLDSLPISLSWNDIPQSLYLTRLDQKSPPFVSSWLAQSDWVPVGYSTSVRSSSKQWRVGLRTKQCDVETYHQADDPLQRAKTVASKLDVKIRNAKAYPTQAVISGYPVKIYYVEAQVDLPQDAEWSSYFSYAYTVVPEGLAAVGTAIATVQDESPIDKERIIRKLKKQVGGQALRCREPTIWGWYFNRSQYLDF